MQPQVANDNFFAPPLAANDRMKVLVQPQVANDRLLVQPLAARNRLHVQPLVDTVN